MPEISIGGWTRLSPDVARAMRAVPREKFVPPDQAYAAYYDQPLAIGYGQTISQPSLVATMTELLDLRPGDKVLEIGTGSGYQAAVLAALGYVDVYTVEIIPQLASAAAERLADLGYTDVHLRLGDGHQGWPEEAPFDAVIVTAAPSRLPPPLEDQLAEGGRLVVPIGPRFTVQILWKYVKRKGRLKGRPVDCVAFVPLTRAKESSV